MQWAIDLLALATSCLALYFNLRLKKTYFLDSKFFLALSNTGFIFVILGYIFSKMMNVPSSIVLFVLLNGLMAASVGFASFLLERSGGGTGFRELKDFLASPPKTFSVYFGIVLSWTALSVLLQPFQLQQTLGPEGPLYYYTYDTWWLAYSAILVGSFFAGPVYCLYRHSLRVTDPRTVRSMRMLVFGWTGFGMMEFIQGTAGSYSALAQDIGALVDSFLFILISLALREPTLIGRVISGGQAASEAVYSSDVDTIVLYNSDSDRRRLLASLVEGERGKKWNIEFFVPKTDIPLYTPVIMGTGSAARSRRRKFGIEPLETLLKGGREDSETINFGYSTSVRELIDIGELDRSTAWRIINLVGEHDTHTGPGRIGRIWAVKASASSMVEEIRKSSPDARVIDLAGQQESFSKLLDLEHPNLLGSRILLEYDPSTNFENVVLKFALEFQANVEPLAVFTSMGSPLYRRAKDHHNIRLFTSSSKTSTPLKISEEEVLLPDRDISLLLDAVDKLLQAYHGRSVGMILDMTTDLILSLGFEKTYGVLSSISEMAEVESATMLLLVNHLALDERALNGIRGLFRFYLTYDGEGLRRVRVPDKGPRRLEEPESVLTGRSVQLAGS